MKCNSVMLTQVHVNTQRVFRQSFIWGVPPRGPNLQSFIYHSVLTLKVGLSQHPHRKQYSFHVLTARYANSKCAGYRLMQLCRNTELRDSMKKIGMPCSFFASTASLQSKSTVTPLAFSSILSLSCSVFSREHFALNFVGITGSEFKVLC